MIEFLAFLLVMHVIVPTLIDLDRSYYRRWGQHSWSRFRIRLPENPALSRRQWWKIAADL